MVEQYPDSISIIVNSEPSQDQSTGNWTEGSSETYSYNCRAEMNSEGRKITGSDGTIYDYSFIVHMPLINEIIPLNSAYTLIKGGITYYGTVKDQVNGQFNTRLWL